MPLPAHGKLAGIDFGEKRIGVAICDAGRRIASPLETHHRVGKSVESAYFQDLARENQLVGFVVGLPIHAHGEESDMSRAARRFGDWLAESTSLPVAYIDERYTSARADVLMSQSGLSHRQKKARRDQLAAQVLLASYLESATETNPNPRSSMDFVDSNQNSSSV